MNAVNDVPSKTDQFITSVHAFSMGSEGQHQEHRYGSRLPSLWLVLTSRSWIKVPINVFVLEHRDGLVLFDVGLDPAIVSDPVYVDSAIGRFFQRRLFRIKIAPDDTLANKLEGLGYAAVDVRKVIVSHLHFGHAGCIKEVPEAELMVSRDEWR